MTKNGLFIISLTCFQLVTIATGQHGSHYQDDFEEYSREYDLDTYDSLKFLATPQSFSVEIGDDITLPCDVDKSDESYPLMFKYVSPRKKSRMIYVGAKPLGRNPRIRKEGNSFILTDVRKSDAGNYVCRFESQPVVELIHTLNVQYPARVERVSDEVEKVIQGTSISLACKARGNPPPAITWSKKDGHLPSGAKSEEGLSITLPKVTRHVEGTYICTASNGIGEPSSTSITIQVEYKPEITTEQAILNSGNGYEAILTCKVHARPFAKVTWLQGDTLVSSPKHIMTHDGGLRHSITIKKVTESDFGEYKCRARNEHGETYRILFLTGLPKAPKMTSNPNGVNKLSYVLVWKTETFAPITQYRVRYRKVVRSRGNWVDNLHSPEKSSMNSRETRFSDGQEMEMKHALVDLQPGVDYEAEVRVENKFGWSPFSKKFNFFTKKVSYIDYFSEVIGHPSMMSSSTVIQCHLGLLSTLIIIFL